MISILIGSKSLRTLRLVGALRKLPGDRREGVYSKELLYSPSYRKAVALGQWAIGN